MQHHWVDKTRISSYHSCLPTVDNICEPRPSILVQRIPIDNDTARERHAKWQGNVLTMQIQTSSISYLQEKSHAEEIGIHGLSMGKVVFHHIHQLAEAAISNDLCIWHGSRHMSRQYFSTLYWYVILEVLPVVLCVEGQPDESNGQTIAADRDRLTSHNARNSVKTTRTSCHDQNDWSVSPRNPWVGSLGRKFTPPGWNCYMHESAWLRRYFSACVFVEKKPLHTPTQLRAWGIAADPTPIAVQFSTSYIPSSKTTSNGASKSTIPCV